MLLLIKNLLFFLLLQVDIKEKIENAPDKGYEIGVVIGTYLPFVVLVFFASQKKWTKKRSLLRRCF